MLVDLVVITVLKFHPYVLRVVMSICYVKRLRRVSVTAYCVLISIEEALSSCVYFIGCHIRIWLSNSTHSHSSYNLVRYSFDNNTRGGSVKQQFDTSIIDVMWFVNESLITLKICPQLVIIRLVNILLLIVFIIM
jgi:hypothetical protein